MKVLVSDATSLIILSKLGRLELLHQFFETVVIPRQVWQEIHAKPGQGGIDLMLGWMQVQDGSNLGLYRQFCLVLDPGESEALALAVEFKVPVLMDEKKRRALAKLKGISVFGLIGLLVRAVHRQFLSVPEAKELFAKALTLGFRASPSLSQEFHAALDPHDE